ncbi:MAG: 2-amino-4-hydroxy-6-hydroxymethyldihydropteridine diphosphokinase, partial [Psychrobacter sp.]|nr:2-amino-4-hydroxy-6-hydroxymethyldihydropteridine diphosphokinase [Psychrobacter sp.]
MDCLKKQPFEQLQAQIVNAVIIALGSNYQAEQHLATVRQSLAKLGEIKLSIAYQNPDITATSAQPKPDYINQCAYLVLTLPMTLQQLQQRFKQFESDCDRQRQADPNALQQVTMD